MKITAALATAPKTDFKFAELDLDEPRGDEILVGISAVGLCHTDIVARDQVLQFRCRPFWGMKGRESLFASARTLRKSCLAIT